MSEDRFEAIKVGDEAEILHTITLHDVDTFANLTGDSNPLHMDESYAKMTPFRRRVVHGMLTASFISTIIGTKLPGEGALWYEQRIRYLAPVRIGEKIRIWAKVKQKSVAQRILVLETVVFGEGNRKVIEGEGKVKVMKKENEAGIISNLRDEKGAVIITGSSRGIGAAVAIKLAAEGYPVVVNYVHNATSAKEVQRAITANGGRALAIQADVTRQADILEMVNNALQTFSSIDGIVNNATLPIDSTDFIQLSWENIQSHIDIQIRSAFHLCQAVIPHFLEKKSGAIVNIGSVYVDNAPPVKITPYCLAKSALVALTRCLAVEFGPKGIRVNMVSPGMTDTDLISNTPEKVKMVTKMQTPLRRLALPEDIADTVAFLISEKARHITGQNIRVCGGVVMQ